MLCKVKGQSTEVKSHVFSESGGVQKVFSIEFYNGGKVAECLVSDQVQLASPRHNIMTDFIIFTAERNFRTPSEHERGVLISQVS